MKRASPIVVVAALLIVGLVGASQSAGAKVAGTNGRIAFSRYDPETDDNIAYTANPDGSDEQQLLPGFRSSTPRWSPDSSEVAVVSGLGIPCPPTCTGNTVIVDPDTGDYRVLLPQGYPDVSTFCSIWSPDATHFACEGGNDDDHARNGVYTIRSSDGGGLTRLTDAHGGRDIPIDYSPDGTQIAFGRFDMPDRPASANSAIFVVGVDGTGVKRITPWGFSDNEGSWSPDGTEIAFEHLGSLFVVHPDGTALEKIPLAVGARSFAGDFSWSPDGTKVLFLLYTQTGAHTFSQGLATANADGTDVEQITTSPTKDHEADWGSHPVS
jgi:Tol biopolymer transport system component